MDKDLRDIIKELAIERGHTEKEMYDIIIKNGVFDEIKPGPMNEVEVALMEN